MQMFNANVEVDRRDCDPVAVLATLAHHHASLGQSPRGWCEARISLPAETLAQATAAAIALVTQAYDAQAIACEVMTEAEFDARQGWTPAPVDELSVTEAAEILGVTRQRVLQMLDEGKLPGHKVGRAWIIPRSAVDRA